MDSLVSFEQSVYSSEWPIETILEIGALIENIETFSGFPIKR